MQAKLRPHLAALLLLAPAAATFLPATAQAQERASVAAPTINALQVNADDGVAPGSTLRLQLRAAPRAAQADVVLGKSGVVVPLRESAPGVYTGTYVVRRADHLDPTQLLAARVRTAAGSDLVARNFSYPQSFRQLALNGPDRGPAGDDRADNRRGGDRERPVARDMHPPQITDLAPANGERISERGRARISARLSDEGSGIDPASVRVRLQGRDVTGDARVFDDEVRYRADLDPGRYSAQVTVRDRAGNSTTKTWTFDVAEERGRDERMGDAGVLPLQITSPAGNALVDGDGRLLLQGRTVPYASVRVQVESVANVGGLLGVTTPVLDQVVQADRNGVFGVAVSAGGYPGPGQRYDVRMTATSEGRSTEERMTVRRQG